MFEHKTFETILGNMLNYVSSRNPELDTRDGSIIYTALAPIALELETAYHEMDMILEETFIDTASKEYLVKHGDQLGSEINEASYGHFKGEFDVDVEIGSRFNLDKINYCVIEKLSDPTDDYQYYTFELVCETAGSEPNTHLGDLTPITYVANLNHAKLISVIIYGEDEEDTEAYRYRLKIHAKNKPVDGNVAQYDEWLSEYAGIGKYKIMPCWNGVNTVKLLILNSENEVASDELVSQVQDYFDPPTREIIDITTNVTYPQGRGMGNGQAPIGSIITVGTATKVPVVITCGLTLREGYDSDVGVEDAIRNYLKSIAFDKTTINYMAIAAEIYKVDCVEDIDFLAISVGDTVMNPDEENFIQYTMLKDNEIAVLNSIVTV